MIKQIIAIRRDLRMRRGKEIAQGAHAAMAFLTNNIDNEGNFYRPLTPIELAWITGKFTKIVVQVSSYEELMHVKALADHWEIKSELIVDSGATEFGGVPTATAVAIGPDDSFVLDPLFGDLKLY